MPDTPHAGLGRMLRFALRRERVRVPVWAFALSALIAYFAVAIEAAYSEPGALQARAELMRDPAGALMSGPGYGLEDYTFGVMVSNELLGMLAVAAALMSVFLVVRHTRADEETGRAELLRAAVVGRYTLLTAAVLTLVAANAAVAAGLTVALTASGLVFADSAAIGLGTAGVGLVLGAVAAVTSQVVEHARTATGSAGAVLGLVYVLRGVGDAQQQGGSALSWASPVGWAQQMRAFVDLRWWPLALTVVTAVVLLVLAYALVVRRDVGAGLVASRRGRAHASRGLVTVSGLTLRTERGSLVGWAVGLAVFGVLSGSLAQGIVDGFEAQPELRAVFGVDATSDEVLLAALSAFVGFFAMAVAVHAVVGVGRLRREEAEGRAAAVLVAGASRTRWVVGSWAVTAVSSSLLLLVSGAALGVGAAASVGDGALVLELALGSLAYVPLVLVFAGAGVLAHGWGRAGTWWVWVGLVGSIVVGLYGPLMNLPEAVLDAAPFGLVPAMPAAELDVVPLAAMALVALGLTAGGLLALRRRDLRA
ncbi:polyketide antibiotic transporter [Cellulomonas bogoriensis 69B4 = DSM 16987]|uniref:Polyketide antibiotic transporter n=1 Tax=Cellulomonas bogoriensis 69B4 = DSM 16987 TaxID=1386082 RepID=A0A0A0C080_9CELL|nr:polyketide antibiotic transporter [Cellulomonas bogoriensis 69B4 = DSM 16987]